MALNIKLMLLQSFVFCLSLFCAALVCLRVIFMWIRRPSKNIFEVKKRESPPKCLLDPNLGNHRYIQLKNVKLHYVEKGDRNKPLMLFLHGFPEFWYSWRNQIKEFSKDYWTVAIDMRGYGDSEKPKELDKYKKSVLVEDVKNLLQGLGKEKCILVAHDWGGVVAWSFISHYPEMVEKYIIMNAPHPLAYRDVAQKYKKQYLMSWYMIFFQLPYLPEKFSLLNDMAMFKALKYGNKNDVVTKEDMEAYKYTFGKPGALTGPINYYRANVLRSIASKAKATKENISVPGLLIWGENDLYLDKRIPEMCKNYASELKIEMIKGANHFVQQDDPACTNAAMKLFLHG